MFNLVPFADAVGRGGKVTNGRSSTEVGRPNVAVSDSTNDVGCLCYRPHRSIQQLGDFGVERLTETEPPAFDDRVAQQGGVVSDTAFAPPYGISLTNS